MSADYDAIDVLIDSDPIALGKRCREAEAERDKFKASWQAHYDAVEREGTILEANLAQADAEVERLRGQLTEAVELLREPAWLHGLVDPPHPDWSATEHEEAEERWLLNRAWPWLIVNGYHAGEFSAIGE